MSAMCSPSSTSALPCGVTLDTSKAGGISIRAANTRTGDQTAPPSTARRCKPAFAAGSTPTKPQPTTNPKSLRSASSATTRALFGLPIREMGSVVVPEETEPVENPSPATSCPYRKQQPPAPKPSRCRMSPWKKDAKPTKPQMPNTAHHQQAKPLATLEPRTCDDPQSQPHSREWPHSPPTSDAPTQNGKGEAAPAAADGRRCLRQLHRRGGFSEEVLAAVVRYNSAGPNKGDPDNNRYPGTERKIFHEPSAANGGSASTERLSPGATYRQSKRYSHKKGTPS